MIDFEENYVTKSKGRYLTGAMRAKTVFELKRKKGDYTNIKFNITAHLNSRGIKKLVSSKAIEKSHINGFTESEHFEAASTVNDLYKMATIMTSDKDKNGSPDILSVKRFYTEIKMKSGKFATAKITVIESQQNSHTIHSIELYTDNNTSSFEALALCRAAKLATANEEVSFANGRVRRLERSGTRNIATAVTERHGGNALKLII